ncbi:MAG: hypothetical protein A2015_05710 [Spirochaetes bacterium GWF1_31_7]|nr:MAG: hypothetical protein A2Y30_00120 [Spirochaetes bacterium GWE1_32_154]OHD47188.1 MAG: hypothetical protein A2Y29_10705 [Spirochaetes bacterium GWE2_31_10]OHD48921.1 MAG: hypothetical protein A2015_05710 [Spirochaetes bacterium GWF1_31_7]OHD76562.1 MAG: hypothetical protein A2355_15470 [Spirochaetes bacterium RIFOXYB1_FULL_32_8]HBD92629.1 hypothetical protein [Spirochaetia bacterium]
MKKIGINNFFARGLNEVNSVSCLYGSTENIERKRNVHIIFTRPRHSVFIVIKYIAELYIFTIAESG